MWAGLLTLLSACSFHQPVTTLPPVGPAPLAGSEPSSHNGCLVVYSAWSVLTDMVNHHSRYTLVSSGGKLCQEVRNQIEMLECRLRHLVSSLLGFSQ